MSRPGLVNPVNQSAWRPLSAGWLLVSSTGMLMVGQALAGTQDAQRSRGAHLPLDFTRPRRGRRRAHGGQSLRAGRKSATLQRRLRATCGGSISTVHACTMRQRCYRVPEVQNDLGAHHRQPGFRQAGGRSASDAHDSAITARCSPRGGAGLANARVINIKRNSAATVKAMLPKIIFCASRPTVDWMVAGIRVEVWRLLQSVRRRASQMAGTVEHADGDFSGQPAWQLAPGAAGAASAPGRAVARATSAFRRSWRAGRLQVVSAL